MSLDVSSTSFIPGGGVLPMMGYTWRLRPTEQYLFQALLWKGRDFTSWSQYNREGKYVILVCKRAQKG